MNQLSKPLLIIGGIIFVLATLGLIVVRSAPNPVYGPYYMWMGIGGFLAVIGLFMSRSVPRTVSSKTEIPQDAAVLVISVPPTTKWQPLQAEQFIENLMNLGSEFIVSIVATPTSITWEVTVAKNHIDSVTKSILSFYPHASIETATREQKQKEGSSNGYFSHQETTREFIGAGEFIHPFMYAHNLKDSDPLAGVIGAMTHLAEGERIEFSIAIKKDGVEYNKIGWKKIHHGAFRILVTTAAAMDGSRSAQRELREGTNKFKPDQQKLFEEKVRSTLRPATIVLTVKADRSRHESLERGVLSATNVWNNEYGLTVRSFILELI